jgi:hypothetical protein
MTAPILPWGDRLPLGLSFTRSYISSKHLDDRGMGNWWTHNYDISLSRLSHGNPGLGMRQPVDAAALISALYINLDLMRNQDDIKGWILTVTTPSARSQRTMV